MSNCQRQTCPTVCRSIKLLPLTVSPIMKNADTIKQSIQHAMTISVM